MLVPPLVHMERIERAELNRLLTLWSHKVGPLRRPIDEIDAHVALFAHGRPVAVAAASTTVREVVGGTSLRREDVVELSRLCAERADLCRAMLRLWREFVWPDLAAVYGRSVAISYQDRALHSGNTYRFDGWRAIGRSSSGRDARSGAVGRSKTIWAWPPSNLTGASS